MLGAALALGGCSDDEGFVDPDNGTHVDQGNDDGGGPPQQDGSPPQQDGSPPQQDGSPPQQDSGGEDLALPPLPDVSEPGVDNKVAAVQYGAGQAALVKGSCSTYSVPDVCALRELTLQARQQGATIVVLPEYAIDYKYVEPVPAVGTDYATTALPDDATLKIFAKTAKKLQIYVAVDLQTYEGQDPNAKYYNTLVAFGPDGKVVAYHHKFNLFGNENSVLTAGDDVTVFDTPLGKMGLLICADIYGSSALLTKLTDTLGARVVGVSSFWTVSNPIDGYYRPYANNYDVYAIVANTTHSPGYGGGVFDPLGDVIAEEEKTQPSIVYATIPYPR